MLNSYFKLKIYFKMKKYFILLYLMIQFINENNGQDLFFIGEKSYPSSHEVGLTSISEHPYEHSIYVQIAKDGENALFVINISSESILFEDWAVGDNLLIYLDNGTVITCKDKKKYDHVNNISTTVYYLTKSELEKIKISNINTLRYNIICKVCTPSSRLVNAFTATNSKNIFIEDPKGDVTKPSPFTFIREGITGFMVNTDFGEIIKDIFQR